MTAAASANRALQLCAACGIPRDAQYFDVSRIVEAPKRGHEVDLGCFEIPAQYCGVLEYFAQYKFPGDTDNFETPNLRWSLRANGTPLSPYFELAHIVNPWGFGSFPVAIRLDEGVKIQQVVRRVDDGDQISRVGGRIVGRYWYNHERYGSPE